MYVILGIIVVCENFGLINGSFTILDELDGGFLSKIMFIESCQY